MLSERSADRQSERVAPAGPELKQEQLLGRARGCRMCGSHHRRMAPEPRCQLLMEILGERARRSDKADADEVAELSAPLVEPR
jgi:hypothetical protein